jgi:transposase
MTRHALTDSQWERLQPLLPPNGNRGGQWKDHRRILDGMLWRLYTGCPWRDVPPHFGPWQTVWDRFDRWSADGTLLLISRVLRAELDRLGQLDWSLWSIDGSIVRAHQAAAGASEESQKKDRRSQRTMR